MTVDSLAIWQSTFDALPNVETSVWADNFAAWYASRVVLLETDPLSLDDSNSLFTFNQTVFKNELETLTNTQSESDGINSFADAWLTAMQASTFLVFSGCFIPPASSATTFSVVSSVIIDPTSMTAGKNKLLELIDGTFDNKFAEKFREATLELTVTVTGLDSQGGSGPFPLVASNVPLI